MTTGESDLDPRWEWEEIGPLGGPTRHIRSRCRHLEVDPISTSDEGPAKLCRACGRQLPADHEPDEGYLEELAEWRAEHPEETL